MLKMRSPEVPSTGPLLPAPPGDSQAHPLRSAANGFPDSGQAKTHRHVLVDFETVVRLARARTLCAPRNVTAARGCRSLMRSIPQRVSKLSCFCRGYPQDTNGATVSRSRLRRKRWTVVLGAGRGAPGLHPRLRVHCGFQAQRLNECRSFIDLARVLHSSEKPGEITQAVGDIDVDLCDRQNTKPSRIFTASTIISSRSSSLII